MPPRAIPFPHQMETPKSHCHVSIRQIYLSIAFTSTDRPSTNRPTESDPLCGAVCFPSVVVLVGGWRYFNFLWHGCFCARLATIPTLSISFLFGQSCVDSLYLSDSGEKIFHWVGSFGVGSEAEH